MVKKLLMLFSLFIIFSCDNKEKKVNDIDLPTDSTAIALPPPPSNTNDLPEQRMNKWINYYKNQEPSFSLKNFIKEDSFKLKKQPATSIPSYSEKFDQRYLPLFSYNANHSKYIDIDSYLLKISKNNEISYNVDQEIVLVDESAKEAHRLLFYGPSFWVEDAFFKNDSIIVLLENSNDRVPGYQEINLNTMVSTAYNYKDTLNFNSKYYHLRVKEILNEKIKP